MYTPPSIYNAHSGYWSGSSPSNSPSLPSYMRGWSQLYDKSGNLNVGGKITDRSGRTYTIQQPTGAGGTTPTAWQPTGSGTQYAPGATPGIQLPGSISPATPSSYAMPGAASNYGGLQNAPTTPKLGGVYSNIYDPRPPEQREAEAKDAWTRWVSQHRDDNPAYANDPRWTDPKASIQPNPSWYDFEKGGLDPVMQEYIAPHVRFGNLEQNIVTSGPYNLTYDPKSDSLVHVDPNWGGIDPRFVSDQNAYLKQSREWAKNPSPLEPQNYSLTTTPTPSPTTTKPTALSSTPSGYLTNFQYGSNLLAQSPNTSGQTNPFMDFAMGGNTKFPGLFSSQGSDWSSNIPTSLYSNTIGSYA